MTAKILLLVLFFAITIAVGVVSRKKATDVGSFVLGGRNVGPWMTAFAYGTTYFSAVVFVGYAGQFGWGYGISATWIGLGNALIGSLLAWAVMGRRTRIMTKHYESATMPDFFGKRYDSKVLKIAASVLVFVFLIPYSASVYKGLSGLFSTAFELDFTYCVIGMAVLTAIYVILGGYVATAINDFIQGIVMLAGIVAIVIAVLNGQGGFFEAINKLSQFTSQARPDLAGPYTSFFGPDPVNLLGVLVLTSMGAWGLPQMVHKFYSIKNEKAIKTGMLISTLFAMIIAGGSYFMGAFGRLYYTVPENGKIAFDEIVPAMLGSALPDILIEVVVILVLSASMSTLSSLVITSSSSITLDLLKGFIFKEMSQKKQMILIRSLCGFFILLSVIIALVPNNLITTLMSISWGALAGSFLGPFLYGLFWKGTTKAGVWAGFITGVGITVANVILGYVAPQSALPPPNAGAIAILASLIVVPLVSLVTPKLDREHVEHAFSCYDEKIPVSHKAILREDAE